MPNGKPGDHPYTDIIGHRMDLGEPEIAEKVRTLDRIGSGKTRRLVSDLIAFMFPNPGSGMQDYRKAALLEHLDTIEKLINVAKSTDREASP